MEELEQGLGLQRGAVQVVRTQMQKARYAEDVLRLGRHLMAEVSATSASASCCTTSGSGVVHLMRACLGGVCMSRPVSCVSELGCFAARLFEVARAHDALHLNDHLMARFCACPSQVDTTS